MIEESRRLPTGYYLLNFETVLHEVRSRYEDLLHPEERRRMEDFLALPEVARRLFVRMFTRKGPWFRPDDLVYPEIGSPQEALRTLCERGFCAEGATVQEMLPLLVREELAACLQRFGVPSLKTQRREAMIQRLRDDVAPSALEEDLGLRLRPVKPLHKELWSLLCFLFFGNGEQDLSSFVLADTGRVRYEAYAIDPANRLFQSRGDLDFLFSVQALREAFDDAAGKNDSATMEALTAQVLAMDPHPGIRQQRRYHRLLNDLGRSWERRRELPRARTCYACSQLPPARERIVRITEDAHHACDLAIRMASSPLDLSEERFARIFLKRHARRMPEADRWLREHPLTERLPEIHLSAPRQPSVELAALEAARGEGWDGFFAENMLWNALFGLVFWEELFADVPGAFQHRFQSAPLDIGHPAFFARRREAIEHRLREIQDRDALIRRVWTTAEAKWGIANAFISWRHLTRDMLTVALERVPPEVMGSILRTIVQAPRAFSSGFPDLFLFKPDLPRWALWEVKGPGDSLRPEQERWLKRLLQAGCEVRVAWVKWVGTP